MWERCSRNLVTSCIKHRDENLALALGQIYQVPVFSMEQGLVELTTLSFPCTCNSFEQACIRVEKVATSFLIPKHGSEHTSTTEHKLFQRVRGRSLNKQIRHNNEAPKCGSPAVLGLMFQRSFEKSWGLLAIVETGFHPGKTV